MAVKLALKKRDNGNNIILPMDEIRQIFASGDLEAVKNQLYKDLSFIAKLEQGYIHDRIHLAMVCNWVPEGGVVLTMMADWLKLARKVNHITDDNTELNLSRFQADLIWKRLVSNNFKVQRADPTFFDFVLDFMDAIGEKSFPGQSVDTEDDTD